VAGDHLQPDLQSAALFVQHSADDASVHSLAGGAVAVFSARSPDKETANEDAAAIIPTGPRSGILAVADGMGGLPAGEQASQLAIEHLLRSITESLKTPEPNTRAAILDGIEAANRAVSEIGVGAATTLAVVEIQDDTLRPYHVGDSMILLVGQRGKIKLQTVSHSPVGYAVEAGFLDEAEAMYHDERHFVSNMIGSTDMHITIGSTLKLGRHDTILLASDGLLDNLHTEEIVERIRKGPLPRTTADMAAEARRRMSDPTAGNPSKPDDLTFIAFRRTG